MQKALGCRSDVRPAVCGVCFRVATGSNPQEITVPLRPWRPAGQECCTRQEACSKVVTGWGARSQGTACFATRLTKSSSRCLHRHPLPCKALISHVTEPGRELSLLPRWSCSSLLWYSSVSQTPKRGTDKGELKDTFGTEKQEFCL